jgi:hypothetical protein
MDRKKVKGRDDNLWDKGLKVKKYADIIPFPEVKITSNDSSK